jgi:hypothetical protein
MGEVVNLRKREQMKLDDGAVWGMLSSFADDPKRPLPRKEADLAELGLLLGEAKHRIALAHKRVLEALCEVAPF